MTVVAPPLAPRAGSIVHPDPLAALLLIIGGVAGLLELLLPWRPAVSSLPRYGSLTGWDLFVIGRNQQLPAGESLALYAVLGVAVAGGACILLGLATMAPIDHQPLGAIALLLGVASIGGAVWWAFRSSAAAGGWSTLLRHAQPGLYLFLASGVLIVVGAVKALATR